MRVNDSSRTVHFCRLVAAACLALAPAGWAAADPIIITSASKQFVVRGKPQTSMLAGTHPGVVYVDPALLVMVCERVREALQRELHWPRGWRDSIFINVHPASGRKEQPFIQAIPSGDRGWRYRMEMPDELPSRDFLQIVIESVLLEYANRAAHENSIELPPWLIEGMTEHLMAGQLAGLALQPNTIVVRHRYSDDGGPALRDSVRQQGALTVDQLNWPEFSDSDPKAAAVYRLSAQLFVRELLRLRDGPQCMSAMLALLPEHLNWQTAFLRAFDAHFKRMLDAEKWWSVVIVQTRMHERNMPWPAEESRTRLEEILYTPMQVRLTKEEFPHVTPVALQTLMSDWSFVEQEPILRGKAGQLMVLRAHLPPEFAILADEYRLVIERYLAARSTNKMRTKDASARAVKTLLSKTSAELAALDQRRVQIASRMVALTPH